MRPRARRPAPGVLRRLALSLCVAAALTGCEDEDPREGPPPVYPGLAGFCAFVCETEVGCGVITPEQMEACEYDCRAWERNGPNWCDTYSYNVRQCQVWQPCPDQVESDDYSGPCGLFEEQRDIVCAMT